MNFNIILDYLILSAFVSLAVNYMARNIARRNEILVDLPDKSRKFHKRPTPLTGGIAIFISLLISGKIYIDLNELNDFIPLFSAIIFIASFFIIIVFLIDDIKGIRPSYRLIAQCVATYFVIYSTGIYLESFGNLFGSTNMLGSAAQKLSDFSAAKNRDFFQDVIGSGNIPGLNYATVSDMSDQQLEDAYQDYMSGRLSGETDAYGNPLSQEQDDNPLKQLLLSQQSTKPQGGLIDQYLKQLNITY